MANRFTNGRLKSDNRGCLILFTIVELLADAVQCILVGLVEIVKSQFILIGLIVDRYTRGDEQFSIAIRYVPQRRSVFGVGLAAAPCSDS